MLTTAHYPLLGLYTVVVPCRYKNAIKLSENLHGLQNLADSKLAQLRAEYQELYGNHGCSWAIMCRFAGIHRDV